MQYNLKTLDVAHCVSELIAKLSRLSEADVQSLNSAIDEEAIPPAVAFGLRRLLAQDDGPLVRRTQKRNGATLEEFRFEDVMHRLRNAVMHSSGSANASELDWLLKIILTSPAVFDTVRELDNFLSNMTAVEHRTKSTGRDRVVEWYFRYINALPDDQRNQVYLKIARHIFAKSNSNYREWKEILYGGSSR